MKLNNKPFESDLCALSLKDIGNLLAGETIQDGALKLALEKQPVDEKWLVWSIEHDAWWRPNRCGYTKYPSEAGRYSFAAACEIVEGANRGPVLNEAMCPDRQMDPALAPKAKP